MLGALACCLAFTLGCGRKDAADAEKIAPESGQQSVAPQEDLDSNTVIARVNGREIRFAELQSRMEQMITSLPQTPPPDVLQQQIPALLMRVLDNIVTVELLEKAIAEEGVSVAESDVVKQLRQTQARLPEGQRLSELLAAQGSSLDELRENLKRDLAIQKLLEKHSGGEYEPSDEEIEQFYDNNPDQFKLPEMASAHHILIGIRAEDSDEIKQSKLDKLNEIRQQIIAGADFEEMARKHSEGPSAAQGGNLGAFPRGQMLKSFDDAVFSQPIGELGEPVETRFGYHIVRVDERKPARTVGLDEARPNIKQHLQSIRRQQVLADYMKELRDASDLEILWDLSKVSVKFNQQPVEQ
jgi:peptidyl-prolyl cis-trans isomerase C